jgi:hypothetical protein
LEGDVDPALVEIAKLGLQIWFQNMRMANATEEQIRQLYIAEEKAFYENKPEYLPDPE